MRDLRPLVWCEEEMRYLEPAPVVRRTVRSMGGLLRRELAVVPATRFETTRSSVIHAPVGGSHGNFVDASYRRILARPEWARRLKKVHTAKKQARAMGPEEEVREWRELDAATSSDALLMNVFCYPGVLAGGGLPRLLGVEKGTEPEFGVRPGVVMGIGRKGRLLRDRTEFDMRVGSLLVEAKLTENDFQTAPMRLVERYPGFDEVFDREMLEVGGRGVRSYQLIRGVMVTRAIEGARFCVVVDARRRDLLEDWYGVMRAVRSFAMQGRLRVVTWQEIAGVAPMGLRGFLERKLGLVARG